MEEDCADKLDQDDRAFLKLWIAARFLRLFLFVLLDEVLKQEP